MHNKLPSKANHFALPRVSQGEPERTGSGNLLVATPTGFSRRLHRKQTADFLGVSLSWLDKARLTGLGPPYIAIGGRILYDSRDLEMFLQSNRHSSISEQY